MPSRVIRILERDVAVIESERPLVRAEGGSIQEPRRIRIGGGVTAGFISRESPFENCILCRGPGGEVEVETSNGFLLGGPGPRAHTL